MNLIQSKLPGVARIVLGGLFLFSGLNGFLHFMPLPPLPPRAGELLGAFAASGYMFPLIKGVEVVAGALLLAGRFVPLALALLAPILVNVVAFHLVLAPEGSAVPLLLLAAEIFLAWSYRDAFAPMLRGKNAPAGASSRGEVPRAKLAAA